MIYYFHFFFFHFFTFSIFFYLFPVCLSPTGAHSDRPRARAVGAVPRERAQQDPDGECAQGHVTVTQLVCALGRPPCSCGWAVALPAGLRWMLKSLFLKSSAGCSSTSLCCTRRSHCSPRAQEAASGYRKQYCRRPGSRARRMAGWEHKHISAG
ncbi:hypothetical protein T492DRAFT_439813 [Pavlovales sp. CCMP2436]|nr:hypothetical protein T492DRAFT_439813 [Pavlovales sp. CCMP2436]